MKHPKASWLPTLAALATGAAHADAVLDWNEVALAEVAASGQLPPDGARTLAMVHVAVFDAVNAIDRRFEPYALEQRAAGDASVDAAVASASYGVLLGLFPARQQTLAATYAAAVGRVADGPGKRAGIELGERAARLCLERRSHDGTGAPGRYAPRPCAGV
jgi:hypothetical protein